MKIEMTNRELKAIERIGNKIFVEVGEQPGSLKEALIEIEPETNDSRTFHIKNTEESVMLEYNEDALIELYKIIGDSTMEGVKMIIKLYNNMEMFMDKWE